MNYFWKRGEPLVWISSAALASILLVIVVLIVVVLKNGLGVFWPHEVVEVTLTDGKRVFGEKLQENPDPKFEGQNRIQLKVGNRDLYALDFRWISEAHVSGYAVRPDVVVLERLEYGNFYGTIHSVSGPDADVEAATVWEALAEGRGLVQPILTEVDEIGERILAVNRDMERLRLSIEKKVYHGARETDPAIVSLQAERDELAAAFTELLRQQEKARAAATQYSVTMADADGRMKSIPLSEIVRAFQPNAMGLGAKVWHYLGKLKELLLDEPRESNTEGGLFPAIFGTIVLVFLMSMLSFPLGVIAGVYLREYAKDGVLVRLVRIGVNNLAGIPSIVYGVFGLGFFIYGIGGAIDTVFFPERGPTPTFGTGGILWASLTLGLLTVPVVIVSTEEAFGAIPRGIREASMALGATRFQTLYRVLLPMAMPGMITGFILAMARAAGEVAPLMITGVVKLAPALPIDGAWPFFHFDRKFMHLGFHIYDIGFQSPNVEAAKPMVFVTTLLLVLVVLLMSSVAIHLRNSMRKKYAVKSF